MSESSESSPSVSFTPPSLAIPSPALSSLSLTDPKEVTENDRQEAAQLKADANKAFLCKLRCPALIGHPLTLAMPLGEKPATF